MRTVAEANASKVSKQQQQELQAQGYKWSGHAHPGMGYNVKMPSLGDKYILDAFKQKQGVIYDCKGTFSFFDSIF